MKRFLFLAMLMTIAVSIRAQRITKEYKDAPLPKVLMDLNDMQSDYTISFIYDDLRDFTVTANIKRQNVEDAIFQVVGLNNIKVKTVGSTILVECGEIGHRLKGTIIDNNGNPIEFANIQLLSPKDSTYITGGVSNESGKFVIPCSSNMALMRVSYIGMKTLTRMVNITNIGTVKMQADEYAIKEVTVKAKAIRRNAEGLTVNVKGTTLEKLGFADDVLKHLPLVSNKGDGYNVIGKGTPIIYVNNRLVRDNEELKQLNSSEIKNVSIITNPGAEYDATVNAVIRISTLRPTGEGFGGQFDAGISQERRFSHNAGASVTYRKGGLDIAGSLRYNKDKGVANQTSYYEHNRRVEDETIKMYMNKFNWQGTASVNYLWKDKLSTGARYQYVGTPSSHFDVTDNIDAYKNNILVNKISSIDYRRYYVNRHYLNAYANYNFSDNTYLKFDGDLLSGNSTNDQDYRLGNEAVVTDTRSDNRLYAGRLTFATPLLDGTIKVGVDGSYTNNKNRYTLHDETTLENELQSSANEAKQSLFAAFLQYDRAFGKEWTASIGGRFETTNFDYYVNGEKSNDVSRRYSGFYPSASIAYDNGDFQLSLAYRYTTVRPSYFQLRSEVAFNSPYSYEGGSPDLQPEKKNMISFAASWKDLMFTADYSFVKNRIVYTQEVYNNSDSITLFHTTNLDNCRILNMALVYSPTLFKVWKPMLTVSMTKPYMTYNSQHYRKPIFEFDFDNTLKLPHNFMLGLDIDYTTAGNAGDDLCYNYADLYTSAYCVKTFLDDRLRLKLSATNILSTDREKWRKETNGITLDKWNDQGQCTVMLTISYRFNNQKSKYRGEASTDELKRL